MHRLIFYLRLLIGKPPKRHPLFEAILATNTAQIRKLLDSGTAVNTTNERGMPAITFAIYQGNVEIVNLLLEYGADTNARGIQQSLAWAEETKHFLVVDALAAVGVQRDPQIQWNS